MLLLCPICKSSLQKSEKTYFCENKHSYDIAKEGYVNLLPVQKKNSKNPGDNKEMINARRSFLESGHYNPLVQRIVKLLTNASNQTIVDAACGEGYYTGQIGEQLKDINLIGFDISKEAIKKASKKYKTQSFFIAAVNDIPISDSSIDTYLTIFAPIEVLEINRVLVNNGNVIIVSAGPNHMREIAEEIYESFIPHDYNPSSILSSHFELIGNEKITFNIQLDRREDIKSMLQMTPYYWSSDKKAVEHILSKAISVTCDFQIHTFSKRP